MNEFYGKTLLIAAPRFFTIFLIALGAGLYFILQSATPDFKGEEGKKKAIRLIFIIAFASGLLSLVSYLLNRAPGALFVTHMLMIWGMATFSIVMILVNRK